MNFKYVKGFGKNYRVYPNGEVYGIYGLRKFSKDKNGYAITGFSLNGERKNVRRGRVVATAFLGDPPHPDSQVNHINGVKDDDRVSNLEWCSPLENTRHSIATGLNTNIKEGHGRSKLTEKQVREIEGSPLKLKVLASRYGISISYASKLRRGQYWKGRENTNG